jgi:hypothetical protein
MKHGLPFVGVAAALSLIASACGSDKVELEVPSTTGTGASSGSGQGGGSGGTGGGGEGGTGGVGQGGAGGAGQGGAGGAGGAGQGGAGGAGGGMGCVKCSALLMGADPATVCPGTSQMLADDLNKCSCQEKCSLQCALDCLPGGNPSMGCKMCTEMNCKMQLNKCAADK